MMAYRFLHHLHCYPFGHHLEAPPELAASNRYADPTCIYFHVDIMVALHVQQLRLRHCSPC